MILSDKDIIAKREQKHITIEPFDRNCLQPASYDLHLHNEFRVFKPHTTELIDTKKSVENYMEEIIVEDDGSFVLHPGAFALALISEETGVDAQHVGRLEGKSSLARLGLIIHTTAGFLDPGNSLQLTLELFNASPLPIKLYPGMKIAQIAFEELSSPCERPYNTKGLGSKYYGAKHIQESEYYKNFEKQ
ncbi:MAG: dCTP deaminase [Candidatus Woesearchaeota archaeon]